MDFSKLDMEVRDPNNVNDHLKVKKNIISVFDFSISYINQCLRTINKKNEKIISCNLLQSI